MNTPYFVNTHACICDIFILGVSYTAGVFNLVHKGPVWLWAFILSKQKSHLIPF